MDVDIEKTWKEVLQSYFNTKEFRVLAETVRTKYKTKVTYPPARLIFKAFDTTPFDKVRVVILGQDPYPNPGQAMGLAFSVPNGISLPYSLKNIFTELKNDLGVIRTNGDLTDWGKQGILLLNTVLTVEAGKPGSHRGVGWEKFTDFVIKLLSDRKEKLIFVLWGADAQKKVSLIDEGKHFIIKSAHPSPLSAHRGFFGSKPFSQINNKLIEWGEHTIKW